MGTRIKEDLVNTIGDLLEALIDQRIERRLSNTTIRLSGGANDADDDPDGGGFRSASSVGKKKRSGKKKAARRVGKVGKVGKKRAKRTVAANSEESRENIYKLLLQRGPMRVTQIVEITGISQGIVNAHLNVLVKQKRVESLKDGAKVLYASARDRRIGRKTAEKPANGSVPPPAVAKPVAA